MRGRGKYILDYIPEGFRTRNQLADAINVRYHTVYMWEREGKLIPTATMDAGQLTVSLYAKDVVESMVRQRRPQRRRPAHAH